MISSGSTSNSVPSVTACLVIGTTRYYFLVRYRPKSNKVTHSKLVDEVNDAKQVSTVRIDKRLVPCMSFLILNLNGVGKSNRAVRLGQVVDRLVSVELAIQLFFDRCNKIVNFRSRSRRSNISYFEC